MDSFVIIPRNALEALAVHVDLNNPKYELNYIYVDKTCAVSTNTKAFTVYRHSGTVEVPFFVHNSIVKKALADKAASFFVLSPNGISSSKCGDFDISDIRDSRECIIMSYSLPDFPGGRFPDYERILEKYDGPKKLPFVDNKQLPGIFAVERTNVDQKLIPPFKSGIAHFTDRNSPVRVSSGHDDTLVSIIMPILDSFAEFD